MNDLPQKHAVFVANYLIEASAPRAAIAAGFSPKSAAATGARLLKDPAIKAAVARHQAEAAQAAKVTLASNIEAAQRALNLAEKNANPNAMVAAVALLSKLAGHLCDQPLDDGAQQAELRVASRLIADAAESYHLSRNASPEQIVAAAAASPVVTPALFELLRIGLVTEGNA